MSRASSFSSKPSVIYAKALFEGAGTSVREEFKSVLGIFNADNGFIFKRMDSPLVDKENKKQIIENSFRGKLSDPLVGFLLLLVDKSRFNHLLSIFEVYSVLCDESEGIMRGEIKVAKTPDKTRGSNIKDIISRITGKKIEAEFIEDKEVLAGFSTMIGSYYIDYSLSGHLKQMEDEIKRS